MYSLEEFCHLMDGTKTDVLTQLKKTKLIRKTVKGESDMNRKELNHFREAQKKALKFYTDQKVWRKVMRDGLRYDKPYMANVKCLNTDPTAKKSKIIQDLGVSESSDSDDDSSSSVEESSDPNEEEGEEGTEHVSGSDTQLELGNSQ